MRSAALGLALRADPTTVGTLVTAMKRFRGTDRRLLIDALAAIGGAEAAQALSGMVRNGALRPRVLEAIADSLQPSHLTPLLKLTTRRETAPRARVLLQRLFLQVAFRSPVFGALAGKPAAPRS